MRGLGLGLCRWTTSEVCLDIRRMDRVPNAQNREVCGVTKRGRDERIDESILRWFGHIERMEDDRIAKRVCEG